MYVHMINLKERYVTRLSGPFESGIYHVEITNDLGDSLTLSGSVETILDLAEQFGQVQQEIMRRREETCLSGETSATAT